MAWSTGQASDWASVSFAILLLNLRAVMSDIEVDDGFMREILLESRAPRAGSQGLCADLVMHALIFVFLGTSIG